MLYDIRRIYVKRGKIVVAFTLLVLLTFCAVSCGSADKKGTVETGKGTEISEESKAETEQTKEGYAEHIFEIVDLRRNIVDYMRSMSSVEWTPNENFSLNGDHNTWGVNLNFKKGQKYIGLPYTRAFSGLDDFAKHIENGVYKGPCGSYDTMPGNNCSSSCDMAWRRYIVSTTEATYTYVPGYGNKTISPVGEYKYPENNRDTYAIISANSQDVIYEAYTLVKPADAIVKWSDSRSAGHARMISAEPTVVRNAQGKINAGRSYLTVIEQTNQLTSSNGKQTTWLVDKIYTFSELLNDGYVPVTPTVLADGGELKITLIDGNTAENIGKTLAGTIETNARITELEMVVSDADGNEAKRCVIEIENGTDKINLRKYSFKLDTAALPAGKYTYKLTAHTPCFEAVTLQKIEFEK